jgi:hypothetical protein
MTNLATFGIGIYAVTLKHDKGKVTIQTNATSEEHAIRNILAIELAPRNAVIKVRQLK